MKVLSSLAFLAIAGAAGAQAPVPPSQLIPQGRSAGQPGPAPSMRKVPGLSDAGNALYAKTFAAPDPDLLAIDRQRRSTHNSLVSLAMGGKVDIDKLADLLKQQDALQSQFRARQNEITLGLLRQLSDDDRGAYLRYSLTPPMPGTR